MRILLYWSYPNGWWPVWSDEWQSNWSQLLKRSHFPRTGKASKYSYGFNTTVYKTVQPTKRQIQLSKPLTQRRYNNKAKHSVTFANTARTRATLVARTYLCYQRDHNTSNYWAKNAKYGILVEESFPYRHSGCVRLWKINWAINNFVVQQMRPFDASQQNPTDRKLDQMFGSSRGLNWQNFTKITQKCNLQGRKTITETLLLRLNHLLCPQS